MGLTLKRGRSAYLALIFFNIIYEHYCRTNRKVFVLLTLIWYDTPGTKEFQKALSSAT